VEGLERAARPSAGKAWLITIVRNEYARSLSRNRMEIQEIDEADLPAYRRSSRGWKRHSSSPAARNLPRAAAASGAGRLQLREIAPARHERRRRDDAPYARAPGAAPAVQRRRQAAERQMNCLNSSRKARRSAPPFGRGASARASLRELRRLRTQRRRKRPASGGDAREPGARRTRRSIILRSRTKNRAWRAWALAASVVLAVAVAFSFVRGPKNAAISMRASRSSTS